MRSISSLWIIAIVMLLLDTYVFIVLRSLMQHSSDRLRMSMYIGYWFINIAVIVVLLTFPYWRNHPWMKESRDYVFAIILGLVFAKLIAIIFFLVDDIRRGAMWLMSKLFHRTGADYVQENPVIKRSVFLNWFGFAAGTALFSSLVYGFSNKYRYKVRTVKLAFDNLPAAFKGFRIVQISDIHSGSFHDKKAVEHGVDMVLQQKADLILFTGDIVNDEATEMRDYIDTFKRIKAPYGVYSTLGNHDYGDYRWGSNPTGQAAIEKQQNHQLVIDTHKKLGWRLLMNEHVPIERNGEAFALIGIENWGAKAGFPKYGKMDLAYPGAEKYSFKLLMSHDPSHWDAEVRPKYSDIDLMLSGHTHGMQFGVETPWFKWSPVQWVYQQWAGLYKEGKQHLYVNRGYGFIGYPGRVGILPEITVIEFV
jgi:predicted MPP superfamily phosphohydrolase